MSTHVHGATEIPVRLNYRKPDDFQPLFDPLPDSPLRRKLDFSVDGVSTFNQRLATIDQLIAKEGKHKVDGLKQLRELPGEFALELDWTSAMKAADVLVLRGIMTKEQVFDALAATIANNAGSVYDLDVQYGAPDDRRFTLGGIVVPGLRVDDFIGSDALPSGLLVTSVQEALFSAATNGNPMLTSIIPDARLVRNERNPVSQPPAVSYVHFPPGFCGNAFDNGSAGSLGSEKFGF